MSLNGWRLIHSDENAIVTAKREDGQAIVRFTQILAPMTTWTFSVDVASAPTLLTELAEAWKPRFDETVVGQAPAPEGERAS